MTEPFVTGLSSNTRAAVISLLNARLADAIDLKLAVKQAHWNIRGPSFIALHELLDQIAGRMEQHGDTMAERLVQLGGIAEGTTQQVVKATTLEAYPATATSQSDHLEAMRDRLSAFGSSCRSAIEQADEAGDADSADIMTEISRAVDKDLWFIAAHLA